MAQKHKKYQRDPLPRPLHAQQVLTTTGSIGRQYTTTNTRIGTRPASILYTCKYTAGRYQPVSYPDGPITARYRFM